jgi:hypothetical protein
LASNYFTIYSTSHYITFETIYMHYFQILQIYKLTKWTPLWSLMTMIFLLLLLRHSKWKGLRKPHINLKIKRVQMQCHNNTQVNWRKHIRIFDCIINSPYAQIFEIQATAAYNFNIWNNKERYFIKLYFSAVV